MLGHIKAKHMPEVLSLVSWKARLGSVAPLWGMYMKISESESEESVEGMWGHDIRSGEEEPSSCVSIRVEACGGLEG